MTAVHHPLRDYQQSAILNLRQSVAAGHRTIILQLATGAGKTRTAAEIAKTAREKGKFVLFLAPRRELIFQAREAFERQGLAVDTLMAGERRNGRGVMMVASFDTLRSRCIGKGQPLPEADVVIVDEAHILGPSREQIIKSYPDAVVIGLTATPCRADGKGLGEIYSDMVIGCDIGTLTKQGYLVPARYFAPSEPDLQGVKLNKDGDYQAKALGGRVNQPQLIGDVVDNWLRLADGKPTVVFCVDRAHARAVGAAFSAKGVPTVYVDGETPAEERADALAAIQDGRATVLVNVFVATYGLDLPRLEVCVLARPTKSLALMLQMIGRCLRPSPGKEHATVIDHSGAVKRLGFADDDHPWSLDGNESIGDRIQRDKETKKEPKEIDCPRCHYVFKGARTCPSCGWEAIGKQEPIPTYDAELVELKNENRDTPWPEKIAFMAALKSHAIAHHFKPGWAAMKYREKYGVYPNDPRVKHATPGPIPAHIASWIKSRQIAWAKRK